MEIKSYTYQGGEARDVTKYPHGVDYMLMIVDTGDEEVELYAEEGAGDDYEEDEFFDVLKSAIIEQAKEYDIDLSAFDFNRDI